MGNLNKAKGRLWRTVRLRIKSPGGQGAAKDGSRIQTDLIPMDERASFSLRGVAEHHDSSVKVGTAR